MRQVGLRVWDVIAGKCIHTYEGHIGSISSVCFSPNGKLALSGGMDKKGKLWEINSGKYIQTFEGFTLGINEVRFSPDERQIIIATSNKIHIYTLDYDLHLPGWKNWDEGARPYLEIFLTLHPNYTEEDFNNILIPDLQNRGYGWLRPEGVRIKLDELQFGW